jgi:hypothetical protein
MGRPVPARGGLNRPAATAEMWFPVPPPHREAVTGRAANGPAPRRCYVCDQAEARYEAHLDHDTTPVVLLCDACAITEREAHSVVWIRTQLPVTGDT